MNQKLLPRGIYIATLLLFVTACSSGPAPLPDGNVTEIYAIKDLVTNQGNTLWAIDIDAFATTIAQATGLSQLDADTYSIRSEPSGVLVVTASPGMQRKVTIVLHDMRRWRQKNG